MEEFCGHFAKVFGAFCSGELDPGLLGQLTSMVITPFTVVEVVTALAFMACRRSSGIAAFPADNYRAAQDRQLSLRLQICSPFLLTTATLGILISCS